MKRIGDLCGYDKLCFGSENSHTHMAVGMFQNFGDVAKQLEVDPISSENMDKIMWKNTAQLWKINPKVQVKKNQTVEAIPQGVKQRLRLFPATPSPFLLRLAQSG